MIVFGDLTRATPGSLLGVLKRIPTGPEFQHELKILVHPEQVAEVAAYDAPHQIVEVSREGDTGAQILELLRTRLSTDLAEGLVVFTFSGFVLHLSSKLSDSDKARVSFHRWSETYLLVERGGTSWPLSSITKKETFELLKKVLAPLKGKGVNKTNLRPLLVRNDKRLESTATGEIPGLMSILIAEAEKDGVIVVDRTNTGNPTILLKEVDETTVRIETLPVPSKAASNDVRYRLALKESGMGPFPNFRDELYLALEKHVSDGLTVGALILKAVKSLETKHNGHENFSFGPVQKFLTTLLMKKPVLLGDEDVPLVPNFENLNAVVKTLLPNWKQHLDGELVLCILVAKCEISLFDIPALTGTIYPTRDEMHQEAAQKLIAFLKQEGKIKYGDELIELA